MTNIPKIRSWVHMWGILCDEGELKVGDTVIVPDKTHDCLKQMRVDAIQTFTAKNGRLMQRCMVSEYADDNSQPAG